MNVTSRYDNFLFAGVWDEPGGMRLSVVSALARMNFDPWEEAARLATLSRPDAERTLVSTLNLLPGHPQGSAETEILAARLVALLPKAAAATTAKATTTTEDPEQRVNYWVVWLCIAIVMSLLSPHWRATKASAGDSTSTSNAASAPSARATDSSLSPPAK